MKGKCLCGAVEFEILGEIPNLYQCHCSLCRRVTGSSANAALRVASQQLKWLSGRQCVAEYQTESGFKSNFCARCGSPAPNLTRNDSAYWVPAGLLEDNAEMRLAAHLFVASRASWDVIADAGMHYDEMPDSETLDRLLSRNRRPD